MKWHDLEWQTLQFKQLANEAIYNIPTLIIYMQIIHHISLKNSYPEPVAKSSKGPCQIIIHWELKRQQIVLEKITLCKTLLTTIFYRDSPGRTSNLVKNPCNLRRAMVQRGAGKCAKNGLELLLGPEHNIT